MATGTIPKNLAADVSELNSNLSDTDNELSYSIRSKALPGGSNDFNTFPDKYINWANNNGGAFSNAPTRGAYHVFTCFTVGTTHGFQIAIPYSLNGNSPIKIRVTSLGSTGWEAWKNVTISS